MKPLQKEDVNACGWDTASPDASLVGAGTAPEADGHAQRPRGTPTSSATRPELLPAPTTGPGGTRGL